MAVVRPDRVGEVRDLLGTMLRADIELDPGTALDWYEIQLAPRAGPDDPVWDHPIWRFRSDMPHIASIDGSPPFEAMRIRSALPTFRLRVADPDDRVSWELRQDGGVVDKGSGTEGISRDGRSIKVTPARRLRRTNELAKPRGDVLYPPFDSHLAGLERTPQNRLRYKALTGANHNSPEDRFAVDFNFQFGSANLGEWVLAAAGGMVKEVDREGKGRSSSATTSSTLRSRPSTRTWTRSSPRSSWTSTSTPSSGSGGSTPSTPACLSPRISTISTAA